jgi:DNA polymerase-3 subunit gamma/tau
VDDIRELIEGVRYRPVSARYKVYIIDEVHMLSKQAFNGLLKTLEEPPPHVKFVFATTEIRKVPVTVLSRCQRFDLRRIETEVLAAHLADIASKEGIAVEASALSLIARAAEGSVRDGLSLLDRGIAHDAGEDNGPITGESVRAMLGLADRGRVLDLFERVMGGEIALALAEFKSLYDNGADPLVVMQDLLETTHFLTRVKVAPGAEGFFDGGSAEAARAVTMAGKLSVPSLTRAWQMLLKGLIEVRDAANPYPAAEMALVRLAYAADLPPTERLVRSLRESEAANPSPQALPPRGSGGALRAQATALASEEPKPRREELPAPTLSAPPVEIRTLEDIVTLAKDRGARLLATQLETNVHLVSLERGRLQFRPNAQAPTTLSNDIAQRLREWTGERWIVTVASEGGASTIVESRVAADRAKKDAVSQEPFVRAVLDAFPGAEIVAVREREEPEPIIMPSDEEPN